jgi:hypothetical protein
MDGYAPAYVAHNVPLLVVSGLGSAQQDRADLSIEGVRIASEVPPVESEDAQVLLRHFKDSDADGLPWNGREYSGRKKFKVKIVGRVVLRTRCFLCSKSLNLSRNTFYHFVALDYPNLHEYSIPIPLTQ